VFSPFNFKTATHWLMWDQVLHSLVNIASQTKNKVLAKKTI